MIFEYVKQIKALLHFMFKHFFELEFGIKVFVEIFVLLLFFHLILKIVCKFINRLRGFIKFINIELIMPFRVRLFEKLAYSTSNLNWQERADKIKDTFRESKEKEVVQKKTHKNWWPLIFMVLVVWIIGFHYYGQEKRKNYEIFFVGENMIMKFEDWTANTLFYTDESTVECFFHDKIEID